MATKKSTKKSYASGSSKYRAAKPRPRGGKKAGKKGGGGNGNGAEDPIIIGGGSLYLTFDKKFKMKPHASKHKFEHDDSPTLTRVVILSGGTTPNEINLTATDVIKVYHTAAERKKS